MRVGAITAIAATSVILSASTAYAQGCDVKGQSPETGEWIKTTFINETPYSVIPWRPDHAYGNWTTGAIAHYETGVEQGRDTSPWYLEMFTVDGRLCFGPIIQGAKPCTIHILFDGSKIGAKADGECQVPPGGAISTLNNTTAPDTPHRSFYGIVNGQLESYRKKQYQLELGQERRTIKVLTWRDQADLVKARIDYRGKRAKNLIEFYQDRDGRIMVFDFVTTNTQHLSTEPKQPPFNQGQRYYFDQNHKMIKWVDESDNSIAPNSDAFLSQERELLDIWEWLQSRIKAEDEKSAGPIREYTGVFQGIEEGDYVHLRVGTGRNKQSFFILQTDKSLEQLLDNPDQYMGKKITVVWRSITEYLEAAGQETRIDKALSVKLPR